MPLSEFLSYGPQKEAGVVGKILLRKTKDGKIVEKSFETDDCSCTLQEAFQKVNPSLGFNIKLKFDDYMVFEPEYLNYILQAILHVVFQNAKNRPIIFSTFHPDAALLVKKLQSTYPVSLLVFTAVYFIINCSYKRKR